MNDIEAAIELMGYSLLVILISILSPLWLPFWIIIKVKKVRKDYEIYKKK